MTLIDQSNLSVCHLFYILLPIITREHDDGPLRATEGDSCLLACLVSRSDWEERNGTETKRASFQRETREFTAAVTQQLRN